MALRHLESNAKLYGLSGQDLASLRVTALLDVANGAATNVIIQQFIGGVEVLHAVSNVVVATGGS
ncbi:MAG: hypothetical protein R2710_27955 [Acidimicrobiales bacterium]